MTRKIRFTMRNVSQLRARIERRRKLAADTNLFEGDGIGRQEKKMIESIPHFQMRIYDPSLSSRAALSR